MDDNEMIQEIQRHARIDKLTRMKVLLHYLKDAAIDYGLAYDHRYYAETSAQLEHIADYVDDDLKKEGPS